ncbi:MAG: 5-(carboxyamino)imidazole ribonucleotide synthase [Pseudomonadota bacterium]
MDQPDPLKPGATIGILGGGQLGRMLAIAAARLGYRGHIFSPDPKSPAFDLAAAHTVAEFEDTEALSAFAETVDVITFEFENVDVGALDRIAAQTPVHPPPSAVAIAQDRLVEKTFIRDAGAQTAPFTGVGSAEDIAQSLGEVGGTGILKTRRFGYDGKGQARVRSADETEAAWNTIGGQPAILEGMVPFDFEISVVIARGQTGTVKAYTSVRNEHRDSILHKTIAPADLGQSLEDKAQSVATKLIEDLNYVGVLGVEMFVVGDEILVNEIAPRVHNSGHWTLDGAATDQFEQHIRAIAGLPLGDPSMIVARAEMTNLIGVDDVSRWLSHMASRIYLYGKTEASPGRKMGHVTTVNR